MILLILNVIFFISFLGFAYVNLNDKDAWIWVPIYTLPAVLCGLAVFDKVFPSVYLFVMGFYVAYAIYLFFAKDGVLDWFTKYNRKSIVESMQATKPYIEQTREFFGLLIVTGALALNYFLAV
jgi:hypothetical protein